MSQMELTCLLIIIGMCLLCIFLQYSICEKKIRILELKLNKLIQELQNGKY